jgi:hypothetical protein
MNLKSRPAMAAMARALARRARRFFAPERRPPLTLAAMTFFAAIGIVPLATAAPFDPEGADWEGLSQFTHLAERELGTQRVVVTSTLSLAELKREDGLLLVHPSRVLDVDELSSFMRAGGRLVLLDDYGTGDDLLARFGIRRVALPARPAQMLRGNPSLAIAEPASAHLTVRDVGRVVCNHATGLDQPALSPLLVVRAAAGEQDTLLALAGAVGRGRLVAVGDASIAINVMMRYPGNRALATGLVRYLVDDDVWGKRGGKLYVLVNGFEATGSFGDPSRTGGAIADARRAVLDGLETLRRDGLPPWMAFVCALAVALGVVRWTSLRVGRTHRSVVPRFARPLPTVAQGGIAGHAAVLGSPDTSRTLGLLEIKSALEEELATRLGLDRTPPATELVARVRAEGLLDGEQARELSHLLDELARVELQFAQRSAPGRPAVTPRVRDSRVLSTAARVRAVLDAVRRRDPRGRLGRAP